MTSKERVLRAVQMEGPDCVPLFFFNKDQDQSDIIQTDIQKHFAGPNRDISEWGFIWERKDETMGQPKGHPLRSWEELDGFAGPAPNAPGRFDELREAIAAQADRFQVGGLSLSGFTTMTMLAGFENVLEGLYCEPEPVARLADLVFGFEEELIRRCAGLPLDGLPLDGISFADDWGTQNNLIISPQLWRQFFKPRYQRQFELIHQQGMMVIFHCCGQIYEIIPDFIEIGVDVLNLSQPNLFDVAKMGRDFGGKACFMCPVSYQTTSISGTRDDIFNDVRNLVENLGCYNGGLIGYIEEYHSVGMSADNYQACIDAFRQLGRY